MGNKRVPPLRARRWHGPSPARCRLPSGTSPAPRRADPRGGGGFASPVGCRRSPSAKPPLRAVCAALTPSPVTPMAPAGPARASGAAPTTGSALRRSLGLSGSAQRSSRPRGRSLRWPRPCEGLRGTARLPPCRSPRLFPPFAFVGPLQSLGLPPSLHTPPAPLRFAQRKALSSFPPHPRALYGHLSHQAVFPQPLRPLRAALRVKIAFRPEGNTAKCI